MQFPGKKPRRAENTGHARLPDQRGDQACYSDEVDERLDRYIEDRVAEWSPHETFVIDVCDTPDGIRIVEITTLNASGFYAADIQKLALSIEEAYGQGDTLLRND